MSGGFSHKREEIWRAGTKALSIILGIAVFLPVVAGEQYVHLDYDWEGDDVTIDGHPAEEYESCGACHAEEHMAAPKICEDCHLMHGPGPNMGGENFALRADYEVPLVYEHFYRAEEIWVENQSYGTGRSTCFGTDPTLEGTCHGVSYEFRESAGGYFAFNENWTDMANERDPYEYTAPASFLPDTTDCLFCHGQVCKGR